MRTRDEWENVVRKSFPIEKLKPTMTELVLSAYDDGFHAGILYGLKQSSEIQRTIMDAMFKTKEVT